MVEVYDSDRHAVVTFLPPRAVANAKKNPELVKEILGIKDEQETPSQ